MENLELKSLKLENCIYCGACFHFCVLHAYDELNGEELRKLVAGVAKIVRSDYNPEKNAWLAEELEKCNLCRYCDDICPCLVNPSVRNEIAKAKIESRERIGK